MSKKSIASKWGRDKSKVDDGVWINCDEFDGDEAFQLKVRPCFWICGSDPTVPD